jgi:hypothetical protein
MILVTGATRGMPGERRYLSTRSMPPDWAAGARRIAWPEESERVD